MSTRTNEPRNICCLFHLCPVLGGAHVKLLNSGLASEIYNFLLSSPITQFDNSTYTISHIAQPFLGDTYIFSCCTTYLFPGSVEQDWLLPIKNWHCDLSSSNKNSEVKKDYRIDVELTVVEIYFRPKVQTSELLIIPVVAHVMLIFYVMPIISLELFKSPFRNLFL